MSGLQRRKQHPFQKALSPLLSAARLEGTALSMAPSLDQAGGQCTSD